MRERQRQRCKRQREGRRERQQWVVWRKQKWQRCVDNNGSQRKTCGTPRIHRENGVFTTGCCTPRVYVQVSPCNWLIDRGGRRSAYTRQTGTAMKMIYVRRCTCVGRTANGPASSRTPVFRPYRQPIKRYAKVIKRKMISGRAYARIRRVPRATTSNRPLRAVPKWHVTLCVENRV